MSTAIREDLLPQPGTTIAGHYQVEELIGHGGMGAVFGARHLRTQRAVAIKWMLPQAALSQDSVQRFIAEAKATARIEHPNVVHIYDFGEDDGSPYLVMERLRGESLRQRLDRVGRLSPGEVYSLLVPAMKGVGEAHREGIIHRDIKPDNIFLCQGKDGSPRPPKVVDFGISKLYDGEGKSNLTGTGMMMGTPSYMSPEQLNAPKDADARFDVYAFGIVAYEALTGRCPFEADGIFQLVAQIMNADPVPPSQLVPGLNPMMDQVVLRAMHRDIQQRPRSMQELIAAMTQAFSGATGAVDIAASNPGAFAGGASAQYTPPRPVPNTNMTPGASYPGMSAPGMSAPGTQPYGHGTPNPHALGTAPTGAMPQVHPGQHPMARTAVLTPGPQPGAGYPGVPAPYHPPPPKKSGAGMAMVVLAALFLLLGTAGAGSAWYFVIGPGADDGPENPPPPTPVATPTPTPQVTTPQPPPMQPNPPTPPTPAAVAPTTPSTPTVVTSPIAQPQPAVEPEPTAEPDPEPRPSTRRRRRSQPTTQPSRPVVRPLSPRPHRPVVNRPPRTQQGANGAMIIE